ncbi:MAG: 8-amino-7-oxononanoate synthase [Thermodesulfobacteriota bacterium]|nr:8-amino-7-oxononanoate synthase [Thermodesulfobacteriota bacterium]
MEISNNNHTFCGEIERRLEAIKARGLYRSLRKIESDQNPQVTIEGKRFILLSSNNYLGLTTHPQVIEAAVMATKKYGTGAGASRLISGNMELHEVLEEKIATFKHGERAIAFPTGYMANVGLISSLMDEGDLVISDELNHASIIDGCRLSKARSVVYRHRDMTHLEEVLSTSKNQKNKLIVSDGVFSMDGDIAPLPEILDLAETYDAYVLLDDAHATGVIGKSGRGTAEYFEIMSKRLIQMGTFSKALGSLGGYVIGSEMIIDYIINRARSFIFSTGMPPAVAAASIAALDLLENDTSIITSLWENVSYVKDGLKGLDYQILSDESHIIPVFVGDAHKCMILSGALFDNGVYAAGIRPPTVPEGQSRIRVTVMATHTKEDLDHALRGFERAKDTAKL